MQIRSCHPLVEILQWCPRIPRSVAWALDKVYLTSTWSGNSQFLSSSPLWGLHTCCSLGPEGSSPPVLPAPISGSSDLRFRLFLAARTWPCCPAPPATSILFLKLSPRWSVDTFLCLGSHGPLMGHESHKVKALFSGSWMVGLSSSQWTWYPMRQVLPSLCSRFNSQVRERPSHFHNITCRHRVTSELGQRHSTFPPTTVEMVREQDGLGRCTHVDIGQGDSATKVNFQIGLKNWFRTLEHGLVEILRTIAYD